MIAIEANATAQQRLNEYQRLGIGISSDGEKATTDLQTANKDLQFILQSVGSKLVGEVVPAFSGLIGALADSYKNGGLVRVAFDGVRVAAQLVMVPVRALFNAFIQLDAAITSVGKGLGAVFAAIATRSMEPLAAWREEVGKIWETANGRTTAAWAWDSGSTAPTQTGGLATTNTPSPKPGKPGKAGKDNDPTNDPAYREAMRMAQERQRARLKEDEDIAKTIFGWREEENKANKKAAEDAEKAAKAETDALLKRLGVYRDIADPAAKYREQVAQLVRDYEAGSISSEVFSSNLVDLEDKMAKASGAVEEQTNQLSIMERIGQTAFKGLEDSLMTFVSTGKLNFKSFVASVLLDLARLILQIKVIQPLLSGFSKSFSGGGGGFGSLLGNIVGAVSGVKLATGTNYVPYDGMPAILHEGEAVVPKRYNPAAGGAASSAPNVTIQVTVHGGDDPEKTGNAVAGKVQELFVRGIVRQELQTQTRARAIAV